MGYPLRPLVPGTRYFVTMRCSEARFFLRPDADVNALSAYWLARANQRFPDIVLHGVMFMSNHLHLVVSDQGEATVEQAQQKIGFPRPRWPDEQHASPSPRSAASVYLHGTPMWLDVLPKESIY